MRRNFFIIFFISLILFACMKDFTLNPETPESWSPSWSLPVGAVTIPFDSTVFEGFIPEIPAKKDVSIPLRFEDYPVFNFDQEEFSMDGRLAFDFSGLNDDFSQIKLIEFKLKTENGFPTSVRTVLDIKDEDMNTLFSLIENEEGLFALPDLDNDELVVEPAVANSKISITDEKIAQLEDAKYMDFKLAVSTQRLIGDILDVDTLTFKRSYSIGVEVGLRVDLDIDISN